MQAAVFAHPDPDSGPELAYGHSIAHAGFNLPIPDNATTFWLTFKVVGSGRAQKVRGPFDNNKDYNWCFH
ncbi:34336_t:CDS:1, partial [Racocetra persica]